MKLRPLHDWVVVERDSVQTSENGFCLPNSPSNRGKVLAVGPKVKEISPGEKVRFNPFAGLIVRGKFSVTFLHEVDILGTLNE